MAKHSNHQESVLPAMQPRSSARGLRIRRPSVWAFSTFVIALLVAMPVIVILAHVFFPSGDVWSHLASTVLGRYLSNTVVLSVSVALGTTLIGTACAWLVVMCRFPGKRIFEWALLLPLAVPTYVIAYAYTDFLQYAGPLQSMLREWFGWQGSGDYYFPEVRSLGGASLLITMVLYPYVYLLARASFMEQSVSALDVGRTLGLGPWRMFRRVALPLARPAVIGGVSLVLMETLNEFGAVQFFGVDTFTTGIYRTWFGLGEQVAAAQLAACLLVFVFIVVLLERASRGGKRYHASASYQPLPQYRLGSGSAALAFLACFLPILIGFIFPALILLEMAITTGDPLFGEQFLGFAFNSLMLAAGAALVAVLLAVLLSYSARLNGSPWIRSANRVAAMGYAIPGSVVAVGIMIPLAWLDQRLNLFLRDNYGFLVGLVFSGTAFVLIYAYTVRFLAVSFNTVEASLGKVTPSMDAAARTLGQTAGGALRRVHTPIMRGSLLAAGILVFVDVMKELPATIILRPFNFDTLAVRAYSLASDERLAESATSSLFIVAVGIIPVVILSLAMRNSRPGSRKRSQNG